MEDAYLAEPPTLYDVLTEPDDREAITDLVREHDEMDIVPSNIDMTSVEPDLTLMRRGSEQLAPALAEVDDAYDVVLIDCPPHLGISPTTASMPHRISSFQRSPKRRVSGQSNCSMITSKCWRLTSTSILTTLEFS